MSRPRGSGARDELWDIRAAVEAMSHGATNRRAGQGAAQACIGRAAEWRVGSGRIPRRNPDGLREGSGAEVGKTNGTRGCAVVSDVLVGGDFAADAIGPGHEKRRSRHACVEEPALGSGAGSRRIGIDAAQENLGQRSEWRPLGDVPSERAGCSPADRLGPCGRRGSRGGTGIEPGPSDRDIRPWHRGGWCGAWASRFQGVGWWEGAPDGLLSSRGAPERVWRVGTA